MTSHDPDFWEKAGDVCGLYLNPPENAVVWSVDEKSQIQAKSRVNPTKPARPGTPARRDYGYARHGTVVLFAALDVHEGDVAGWVTDSTRSENFVEFLDDLVAYTPEGLELHCIVDNLSAHATPLVEEFLDEHRNVFLHNTPTHASWLNQVELFFSIIERRLLRHGEFTSRDELAARIIDVHQGLQPTRPTLPLDLRRKTPQGRVTHNDLVRRSVERARQPFPSSGDVRSTGTPC